MNFSVFYVNIFVIIWRATVSEDRTTYCNTGFHVAKASHIRNLEPHWLGFLICL